MSAAFLLLLAQQSMAVPTTAAVTPASVTVPSYDVRCAMQNLDGGQFQLGFKQTGGRGYSMAAIQPGAVGVGSTRVETVVNKDTSGRYAGAELWTADRGVWPGIKRTFPKVGEAYQIQFQSVATLDADKVLLQIEPRHPLGTVSAFGLCTIQSHPQTQMSDDEAKQQVSK